jgi:hypothetical protein
MMVGPRQRINVFWFPQGGLSLFSKKNILFFLTAHPRFPPTSARAMITRMISLVPSNI